MSELNLPSREELDNFDFDDLYDEVEEYIQKASAIIPDVQIIRPSISQDDILSNANALIPLRLKQLNIKRALEILEEELDTGHLQSLAQPIFDTAEKLLQNLKQANEMVYLLEEIKITRKKSKRVAKKVKRLLNQEGLDALQSEADELRGLADFSGRIQGYSSRGFNVAGLLSAHREMDSQIDKTQEVFDGKAEEL